MIAGSYRDEDPPAHALREIVVRVDNYEFDAGGAPDEDGWVNIPKVSWEVANKEYYVPEVVSIGPYHYREPKLRRFQERKVEFAATFVKFMKECTTVEAYAKVSEVAGEARGYYSQDALGRMTDEEFTDIMFLDGCFVLEYIFGSSGGFSRVRKHWYMDLKLKRQVLRDLLLLDNQVPFIVLQALFSGIGNSDMLMRNLRFLAPSIFPGIRYGNNIQADATPVHLLDFLRLCLCDPGDRPPRIVADDKWMTFPYTVTRLEEAGIDCRPTQSHRVTAIGFTPKHFTITAELKIPPVHIEEHSMAYWMNLAAFQIHATAAPPPFLRDQGIGAVKYIWMLGNLIDDAEDVRKLRAKQIIVHNMESDELVVALFKNMYQNIIRDSMGMNAELPMASLGKGRVLGEEIQNHLRSRRRRWVYKNVYGPYFRSAWSIPAFFAAVIGLVLTFLQLYYAIYPRHLT